MTTDLIDNPTLATPSHVREPKTANAPVAGKRYQATVFRSLAEFEALQKPWEAFLRETNAQNLCATHAWLSGWLRHFPPDELLVTVVTDETGEWVGVAPLKISKSPTGLTHRLLRHVQFIGTNPTVYDWMKIMVRPGADEDAILRAVANALATSQWDVLDLQFMPDKHQMARLCHHLGLSSPENTIRETMSIPYIQLPETEAAYEKTRRKKTRLEVNRHCNRFAKEFGNPPALEFQPVGEATDAILTRFFSGHIQYWAERGGKSDFQRFPGLYGFYKDMLAHSAKVTEESEPKLLFSVLKIADYQLSYHLGFWQGHSYLSHLTNFNQGFKNYSPGTIHMDALVFDTIRRGGMEFEFGRGDEPYKKMWAQDKKPLWSLRMFRNPLAATLWQVDILLKRIMRKPTE